MTKPKNISAKGRGETQSIHLGSISRRKLLNRLGTGTLTASAFLLSGSEGLKRRKAEAATSVHLDLLGQLVVFNRARNETYSMIVQEDLSTGEFISSGLVITASPITSFRLIARSDVKDNIGAQHFNVPGTTVIAISSNTQAEITVTPSESDKNRFNGSITNRANGERLEFVYQDLQDPAILPIIVAVVGLAVIFCIGILIFTTMNNQCTAVALTACGNPVHLKTSTAVWRFGWSSACSAECEIICKVPGE